MTEYHHSRPGRVREADQDHWATGSAWSGWVWFAGLVMIMTGFVNVIEGLVALFKQDYYIAGPSHVLVLNLTGWGWAHLLIGALVLISGIALLADQVWARVATVVLAGLNAIAQLAFIGVYPLWSIVAIMLCVVVIWALVAHGDESRVSP
ncbi:DUF7144 family membrane protein [Actinokineospora inagensis]|uniref:DUF7144 family membrane protein n=1 Tax=Actinokineospora inagensis TaxID=103730 RepID=UPI00041A7F7C|nr:hypothetical protein [Actinokineospora inagensis]